MKKSLKMGLLALLLLAFVSFFITCSNITQGSVPVPLSVVGTWKGENDTGNFRFFFGENDFEYGGINQKDGKFEPYFKGSYTISNVNVLLTIKEYLFNYEEWRSFKSSPQQTITVVKNAIVISEGITIEEDGDMNFIYRASYTKE
ncbi:MAG: hypothetical protein ACRC4W_05535 [Treponemataceae bacterium]